MQSDISLVWGTRYSYTPGLMGQPCFSGGRGKKERENISGHYGHLFVPDRGN